MAKKIAMIGAGSVVFCKILMSTIMATPALSDKGIPEQGAGKGARPLFDGRTLDGWEGNLEVWRVQDGVIIGGSLNGNARNEFLATTRSYGNFIIRLEYKLAGTEGFINSGVQFRSLRIPEPPTEMSGYQADIGSGHSGCLYDESRRNRFLARGTDEQITRLEKPGEWNSLEVRCDGPRIRILLNGEKTVDYTESDAAIEEKGLIALQIHGGSKAEVCFRRITIEELPAVAQAH
ncbi:MAG: family 16 glycoside hydrolase [Acidobacteriota bacterium]